jgi:hypothetical protein
MIWFIRAYAFFTSPVGIVVAAVTAFGGYVLYQRNDAVRDERARVEERKANDINKATQARQRIRTACERDKSKCLPDRWYRD